MPGKIYQILEVPGWCDWMPGPVLSRGGRHAVTPGFKAKSNAQIMCVQESSLHTYRTENGYKITNVSI
jgi:hypothetical protein